MEVMKGKCLIECIGTYINKEWKDKPLWFSEYIGPISPKK